ncbi:MAG: hypothetical protein MRY64_14600 [Hyphomonadaceae bacterium]|nr:hypothetical protein [Hyphomonadaceae bacterium]
MRGQTQPAKPMAGSSDLQSIEDALDRLETGAFGYCENCAEPIALARLCDNPTISRCKNCDEA